MKSQILFTSLMLALAGCTPKTTNTAQTVKLSDDMIQSTVSDVDSKALIENSNETDEDCFAHIKKVACLSNEKDPGFDSNCSADGVTPEMLTRIPQIIEQLPPLHRKVFCNVNRFQIQPAIPSIAYAGQIYDGNYNVIGDIIGVRADALKGQKESHDLFSWKEQLNFGLSKMGDQTYALDPRGPKVIEGIAGSDISLVLYVITHEVTHLIDFLNDANHTLNQAAGRGYVSTEYSDSFALLSWPERNTIHPGSKSPEWIAMAPVLSQFCYYACTKVMAVENIDSAYQALQNSSFMTAYSTSNSVEDFAESSTMFFLGEKGFKYKIVNASGATVFDFDQSWNSPALAAKKLWLKNFYARTDLKFRYEN